MIVRGWVILSNFKNETFTKTFKTVTQQGLAIQNHCCLKGISLFGLPYFMFYIYIIIYVQKT